MSTEKDNGELQFIWSIESAGHLFFEKTKWFKSQITLQGTQDKIHHLFSSCQESSGKADWWMIVSYSCITASVEWNNTIFLPRFTFRGRNRWNEEELKNWNLFYSDSFVWKILMYMREKLSFEYKQFLKKYWPIRVKSYSKVLIHIFLK